LFPSLTVEEARVWVSEFRRHDRAVVDAAINRCYASAQAGFTGPVLEPGKLREMIATEARRREIGRRIGSERDREIRDRQEMIRAYLGDFTDDQLRELKREAIQRLPEGSRSAYAKLDCRRHRAMAEEIYLFAMKRAAERASV
jgi:hypothetical protein